MTTTPDPAPTTEPEVGKPADPPASAPDPKPAEPAAAKGADRLPDDHPLVTALASIKAELADTKTKLKTFEDANKSDLDKATEQAATEKERADKAEARAAVLAAAVKYKLDEDDLELLDGVPADKVDERAKKLSERIGGEHRQTSSPHTGRHSQGAKPSVDSGRDLYRERRKRSTTT